MAMKKLIRTHLNIKLFLAFLIVVVVGAVVLITAVEFIMPAAFESHLLFMQSALDDPTNTEQALNDDLFISFRSAVYNAMKFAVPSSLIAALIISLTFSQQFINQIKKMLLASKKIRNGDFKERINLPRNLSPDEMDELQQLAVGFNQMTEKLDKNEQLRKELIGDVSHELRTPLAYIKASIESIADGIVVPSSETLQDIQEEIDRLTRLVDDLQELSIIEADSYVLNKKKAKIEDIISPLANQMQSSFKEKGIQFNLEIEDGLPVIDVDVDRIKQVITNILSNAIRFTPEGGRIQVNISKDNGKSIEIAIHDSGIGIPGVQLRKIFTRFYRVDKSRSRDSGGSGIGLTIAKQLVEAHGGSIWAESPGVNKGSTIYFTLPAA
jgi:histidine kinase